MAPKASTPPPPTATTLELTIQTTTAFITTLLSSLTSPSSSDTPPSSITLIRQDFVSLLQLLGKESTSLSLAFKPSASVEAAKATVDKIQSLLIKLEFCVKECCSREGSSVLGKEIIWTAQDFLEALSRLLSGSLACHKVPSVGGRKEKAREQNLKLTGLVWEVVERAQGLPGSELEAMRKSWESTLGMVDDCLEEVKEMEESSVEDDDEDDEEDSEDDEDDFRASHPLSTTQRARVASAYILLRLGRLLLNRLINSTSPTLTPSPSQSPSLTSFSNPSFLLSAQSLVSRLSATSDDFAASLEPPQDDVEEVVVEFVSVVKELSELIEGGAKEMEEKWQGMWRTQLEKAVERFEKSGKEELVVVDDEEEK